MAQPEETFHQMNEVGMIHVFRGTTADDVWQQMVAAFNTGLGSVQGSRIGQTEELLHAAVSIANPRERWVTSRCPAISPALAIAEAIWIVLGRKDLRFLEFWAPVFRRYSDDGNDLHGAYGYRLRVGLRLDQLQRAYEVLRTKPDTRQVVLQIWDGTLDLPNSDGLPASKDIPCNISSLLKLRQGRLEWLQIIRSNDLFLGVPHNFVQFTTLQEVIAGWLGVEVGTYNQVSDSLHIYAKDRDKLRRISPQNSCVNNDSLALAKPESDALFLELGRRAEVLMDPNLEPSSLRNAARWPEAPQPYRNLLLVLTAESARRRRWQADAVEAAALISNPVLQQLWRHWLSRHS